MPDLTLYALPIGALVAGAVVFLIARLGQRRFEARYGEEAESKRVAAAKPGPHHA